MTMCCSIRAAIFFLASIHIFFAVTQMVQTLPVAVTVISSKLLESVMAFIFCISFFATGFMTFRGADEESATLIRLGSFCLVFVIIFRFILMAFSIVLVENLPEAAFLYVYGTPVIPIIFTVILYVIYIALLFCYHNELKHTSSSRQNSPMDFPSPPRQRQSFRNHSLPEPQQKCLDFQA